MIGHLNQAQPPARCCSLPRLPIKPRITLRRAAELFDQITERLHRRRRDHHRRVHGNGVSPIRFIINFTSQDGQCGWRRSWWYPDPRIGPVLTALMARPCRCRHRRRTGHEKESPINWIRCARWEPRRGITWPWPRFIALSPGPLPLLTAEAMFFIRAFYRIWSGLHVGDRPGRISLTNIYNCTSAKDVMSA